MFAQKVTKFLGNYLFLIFILKISFFWQQNIGFANEQLILDIAINQVISLEENYQATFSIQDTNICLDRITLYSAWWVRRPTMIEVMTSDNNYHYGVFDEYLSDLCGSTGDKDCQTYRDDSQLTLPIDSDQHSDSFTVTISGVLDLHYNEAELKHLKVYGQECPNHNDNSENSDENTDLISGLMGSYFEGKNFNDARGQKIAQLISFNWGNGAPNHVDLDTGDHDTFSIRWEGYIKPTETDQYHFHVYSDDGVRLFIDGNPVINNWRNQSYDVSQRSGVSRTQSPIQLTANVAVPVILEYYENSGAAQIDFMWSRGSNSPSVVPGNVLWQPTNSDNSGQDNSDNDDTSDDGGSHQDTIPNSFFFAAQQNVALNTDIQSESITVAGINTATNISITGGMYSINGRSFTSSVGTVVASDQIKVRLRSAGSFNQTRQATLTIGTVSGAFRVTTMQRDTTPDSFSFAAQQNVALNTDIQSESITVAGINTATNISITGGMYSINGRSFTSSVGTVVASDQIKVRLRSAGSFNQTRQATLTIGTVSGAFRVTTMQRDTTPDSFSFASQQDVALNTDIQSESITVAGINTATNISITGGMYSINGRSFTSSVGTVVASDQIKVRLRSAGSFNQTRQADLTIGTVNGSFSVTTMADPNSNTNLVNGLKGSYFEGTQFETFTGKRADLRVAFNWHNSAPTNIGLNSGDPDTFSIRWEGYLKPLQTADYNFHVYSDDGVRLFIDGNQVIDNWRNQSYGVSRGRAESSTQNPIRLTANEAVPVVLEYYENSGSAQIDFMWSRVNETATVIPTEVLWHPQEAGVSPPEQVQQPREQRNILAIIINFQDQAAEVNPTLLRNLLFVDDYSVKKLFEESSDNLVTLSDGESDILEVTLNENVSDEPYNSDNNGRQLWYGWGNDALTLASNQGYNLNEYDHYLLILPYQGTYGILGMASLGGKNSFARLFRDGTTPHPHVVAVKTIAHELGHNLGLNHTGAYIDNNEYVQPNYNFREGGDRSGFMGWALRAHPLTASHRCYLNWHGAETRIKTLRYHAGASSTVTLSGLDQPNAAHYQIIKLSANNHDFFLSYRVHHAIFDIDYRSRDRVHIQSLPSGTTDRPKPMLIEALAAGESMYINQLGTTITVSHLSNDRVNVTIENFE